MTKVRVLDDAGRDVSVATEFDVPGAARVDGPLTGAA